MNPIINTASLDTNLPGRSTRRTSRRPLPKEYRRSIPAGPSFNLVNDVIESGRLHTICISGKCPNRGECFSRASLAFMILGDLCTRHCGFCAVKAGNPGGQVDNSEPRRLAEAVSRLGLRHVVITSVARDDLEDGGASVFAACIAEVRGRSPSTVIEVLTSDFQGNKDPLTAVFKARPDIFNHNLETVERLTPQVRSKATYQRSLEVLYAAHEFRRINPAHSLKIKSGLMLGLGETGSEVRQALADLRAVGCEYLTIGQYLQPSGKHLSIQTFVPMEEFRRLEKEAFDLGFERVAAGPLVRSSYFAENLHAGQALTSDPRRSENYLLGEPV